jgi:hypothetical protein
MSFQIFYKDGPAPIDAIPSARGVQAIVQDNEEVGSELVTSADYYVKINNGWKGVDIFGLFDFLLDSGIVLFGRTISRNEYQEIIRKALKTKETWLPGERKFNG